MENIEEYGIEIQLQKQQKLYQALDKLEKRLVKLNKGVYNSLEASQKSALLGMDSAIKRTANKRVSVEKSATKTILADKLKQEQRVADKIEKEGSYIVEKALSKTEAKKLKHLERVAKVDKEKSKEVADYKARLTKRQQDIESARFKQHISGMTSGSGNNINAKNSAFNLSEKDLELQRKQQEYLKQQTKITERNRKEQEKLQQAIDHQVKNYKIRNSLTNRYGKNLEEEHKIQIKKVRSQAELNLLLKKQNLELAATGRKQRQSEASLKKQNFLQSRLTSSAKQWAGTYVSAFAAIGGIVGVTSIGQDFERAENTLAAITGTTEKASEEMDYLKKLTYAMGVPLRETAKDYSKLMAAAQGTLEVGQLKSLFESLTKASVVMGTSADDTSGILKALSQMLAKQKISAEEYRQQLGDRMPIALQAMTRASVKAGVITDQLIAKYGSASGALEKLMADGKLYSKDVLPHFGAEIEKVVDSGFEQALKSNVNAMNRLKNVTESTSNEIFKSGFEEGLTELFNTSADSLKDLTPLFKSLGRIVGSFFKGLSGLIDLVTPPLRVLGNALDVITEKMGDFSGIIGVLVGAGGIMSLTGKIGKLTGVTLSLGGVAKATAKALKVGWLLPILAIVDALKLYEDMMTQFFWKDRITANYDPRTDEDSKYYDPNFQKEEKESSWWGYDNFKLRKDPFGGLSNGFNSVLGWFSKFNYENGVSQGNPLTKGNTPIQVVVNHKTIVDGEEVASSVVKTDEFANGVNTTILPLFQGGE